MIRLNLLGGLGNQMFQYAFARALAEKSHDEIIEINPQFSRYCNLWVGKNFRMTKNSLEHLRLNSNVKEAGKINGILYGLAQCIGYTFSCSSLVKKIPSQKDFERRAKRGIYRMFAFAYYQCPKVRKRIKYVTGYFANERYFREIKNILMEEFRVKTEPSIQNKEKIKELSSCNAVCVHIRRGDYTLPQLSDFNICNEQYYQRGMDYIEQRIENPVFYVFSNNNEDIAWIKKHYHFKQKVHYIELNNPDYEELRLMYHCKHFVISNSTFSWWGSYLARNENKIIVAPSIWLKKTFKEDPSGIYLDSMVKIPVD